MNSSLTYEILLYLNSYYFGMFALMEIMIAIIKVVVLTYPETTRTLDLGILLLLIITESLRIFLGRKGNLTEKTSAVLLSILLTIPSIVGTFYFIYWQTYILKLEYILCGMQIVLQGFELVFGFLAVVTFYCAGKY